MAETYQSLQTKVARPMLDATNDLTAVKEGILEAVRRIWNLHLDWDFRRIGPTNLTVAIGVETPTLPVDAAAAVIPARILQVLDDLGSTLVELEPVVFDAEFAYGFLQNQRDRPWAFKQQNRVLTLGPRPSQSATFQIVYEREQGFLSGGGAFTVGEMSGNTDVPAWHPNHHRAIIHLARGIAYEEMGNPYAQTAFQMWDDGAGGGSRSAMENALLLDPLPLRYPRDPLF